MRALVFLDSELLLATACVLLWSSGAPAQPCTPGPSGNSNQNVAQVDQQLASAMHNLKSVFGGKLLRSESPSVPSVPCTPSTSARPVSTTSSAAPSVQVAQSNPNDKTPIGPTTPYTSSLIVPAPAGGIDTSKLPDVVGIHIGESTSQVVAQAAKLYPPSSNVSKMVLSEQAYAYTNDPPYTASLAVAKRNLDGCSPTDCQAQDTLNALFSGPPDQRVVELVRGLTWGAGKQPTIDTLRTALIQKYGETFSENPGGGLMMVWLFDEGGQPMPSQSKLAAMNCGGLLAFGGGTSAKLPDYLYRAPLPQVVTQQDLDRFARMSCGRQIFVQAQVFGQTGGTANSMTITIREYAADLRDAFAAENLMRQAKYAQGNQQLQNAQQQSAPKF